VKKAEELILATGAQLIYLPPYSPDLSPIELMWSKIKIILRTHAARTREDFQKAICTAFNSIQSSDLSNWYRHCGYRIK
jgi:transposase